MYPLTVGLAIETKELWEGVQSCVQDLAVRVVIEQQDVADFQGFRERVEECGRTFCCSKSRNCAFPWRKSFGTSGPCVPEIMLIALHASAEPETILSAMRAGVNEFLNPPLDVSLRRALERRASENVSPGRATRVIPAVETLGFLSAKGGCGATTIACHAAVELGRVDGRKVLLADFDMDAGMSDSS